MTLLAVMAQSFLFGAALNLDNLGIKTKLGLIVLNAALIAAIVYTVVV